MNNIPTIFESNAAPDPEWLEMYKEYLINTFNLSRLQAIDACGNLYTFIKKYPQPIDEDILNNLANKYYPDDEKSKDIFKLGYRKAKQYPLN